ncbi:TIGR02300 family protein [Nioella nitratireducens]|uniref:TIGR02300 family protein n=1 Tax=Nioella nitratireducens TaxID=1287720 RepID=UPI0008FD5892|nr:TIGR02300 family protein [Nioella nitratireducens]
MPKEEWGVKRVCPTTGKRFYDLGKNPVVSPYTGETVEIDTGKASRSLVADKADKAKTAKPEKEEGLVDDADQLLDDDESDIDLDDDLLDDDDEDGDVPLDDIADVASDDDDS